MASTIEQRLQALYAGCGYQPFRVKKFERYELYSENRRFLTTEKVLTFTNTDGRLMAMKPDVTLSIVQDTQPEGLRKVFYRENVYREQRPGEGFREIPQTGLECIGALDAAAVGEVVSLAAKSLLAISDKAVLSVSHIGVISGVLEDAELDEAAQKAVFSAVGAKNVPALKTLCGEKTGRGARAAGKEPRGAQSAPGADRAARGVRRPPDLSRFFRRERRGILSRSRLSRLRFGRADLRRFRRAV